MCSKDDKTTKKSKGLLYYLKMLPEALIQEFMEWMENRINSRSTKNIVIAIDGENVESTLKNLDLRTSTKPDWRALKELCLQVGRERSTAGQGEIISARFFTPDKMISPNRDDIYRNGIEICFSPAGKEGKDMNRSDHEMIDSTRRLIEIAKRVDILFIVSDDGDFLRLANFARDRGIQVIIVSVKNPNNELDEAGLEIIQLPTIKKTNDAFAFV